MSNILHCNLPVLRCVADVLRVRPHDVGELGLPCITHVTRLVQRKRRLRKVCNLVRIRNHQRRNLFQRRDDLGHLRRLTLRPFHLFLVPVADEHQRAVSGSSRLVVTLLSLWLTAGRSKAVVITSEVYPVRGVEWSILNHLRCILLHLKQAQTMPSESLTFSPGTVDFASKRLNSPSLTFRVLALAL